MSDQPSNETDINTEATTSQTESTEVTEQPAPTLDDLFANKLSGIKNEQGQPKYKDIPTALDALKHSQEHIPQLKSQLEELKAENERLQGEQSKMAEFEETIQRLQGQGQPAEQTQQTETPSESGALSVEQIEQLLEQKLAQRQQQETAQKNMQSVQQALEATYGDKAVEVVSQKANDLGMTTDQLTQMINSSPKAAMQLLGVSSQPRTSTGSPQSSVSIPPVNKPSNELPPKERSLKYASTKERMERARLHRDKVYRELGISQ